MKKLCMKKVLAVTLSAAMACSFVPETNTVTASAAQNVSLKTAFKTLKTGQTYKMKLLRSAGWSIVRVSSKDSSIAKAYGKAASSFKIKGKSAGRTTVQAKLRSDSNQKKTKTLKCRVKVVEKTPAAPKPEIPVPVAPEAPAVQPAPQKSEQTVSSQNELLTALADSNVKQITIASSDAGGFQIPAGNYAKALIVDAPQADVVNSGVFTSVEIRSIKENTWTEKAAGNIIRMLALKGRIIVEKGASLAGISFAGNQSKISLQADGVVQNLNIEASMELDISGAGETAIPVTIAAAAKDAKLTSQVPADITAHAPAAIILSTGAEKSTIKTGTAGISLKVTNQTKAQIAVSRQNGTKQYVSPGQVSVNVSSSGSTGTGSNSGSSWGGSSGSSWSGSSSGSGGSSSGGSGSGSGSGGSGSGSGSGSGGSGSSGSSSGSSGSGSGSGGSGSGSSSGSEGSGSGSGSDSTEKIDLSAITVDIKDITVTNLKLMTDTVSTSQSSISFTVNVDKAVASLKNKAAALAMKKGISLKADDITVKYKDQYYQFYEDEKEGVTSGELQIQSGKFGNTIRTTYVERIIFIVEESSCFEKTKIVLEVPFKYIPETGIKYDGTYLTKDDE